MSIDNKTKIAPWFVKTNPQTLVQVGLKDPVCRIVLNKCPRSNKRAPPQKRTPVGQKTSAPPAPS